MLLGVPRLKRAVAVLCVVFLASLTLVSCSSSSKPSGASTTGLSFRAFVSQDVSSSTASAGVVIVDANRDVQAGRVSGGGSGLGSSFFPAQMVESNNRATTMAISQDSKSIEVISNSTEAVIGSPLSLPGATQSLVISVDGTTAYVAVPNAPIPEGTPGGIVVVNISGTGPVITATVPVQAAQFVVQSGDGSKLLVFNNSANNANTVTIVSPFNIVPGQQNSTCPTVPTPVTNAICQFVPGFDHPVYGFFSSDNTQAWILNCGPQCGGQQASVQILDLVHGVAGAAVPVDAATVAFLSNQTLYVAGTPTAPPGSSVQPDNACTGITTAAPTCGRLDIVDLPSMTVTNHLVITDGYHTQMNIQDGQLFIGSTRCSNVFPPPAPATGEQRGCLTIVNTLPTTLVQGNVLFPSNNGDVTGLAPIRNRTIMYVAEGGNFYIYDTTTDAIYTVTSLTILGNVVDIKMADF
jgi:hypothetical protein